MKRKPKKFLSGGEVAALAGLGYLGYQAYKGYQAGKKPEETKGGFRPLTREQTDKITPRRESEAAPSEDREKRGEGKFPQEAGYGTSGGFDSREAAPAPAPAPAVKKDDAGKKDDKRHAAEVTKIFKDVKDPNKGKYKDKSAPSTGVLVDPKNAYVDSSGTIYNKRGEPFADTKNVERRVMGVGNKSKSTTAGDPNIKGSTAKGRSENPIQGTIDSRNKSTVRSNKDKMRERALEVQRRREEAEKSRYKKGGSVKTAKPTMRSASSRADGIAIRGKTRA